MIAARPIALALALIGAGTMACAGDPVDAAFKTCLVAGQTLDGAQAGLLAAGFRPAENKDIETLARLSTDTQTLRSREVPGDPGDIVRWRQDRLSKDQMNAEILLDGAVAQAFVAPGSEITVVTLTEQIFVEGQPLSCTLMVDDATLLHRQAQALGLSAAPQSVAAGRVTEAGTNGITVTWWEMHPAVAAELAGSDAPPIAEANMMIEHPGKTP